MANDVGAMMLSARAIDKAEALSFLDRALPDVYGYLVHRTGRTTAEDLTSETMLAAVRAMSHGPPQELSIAWLIGIARHKLADYWRSEARERRHLAALSAEPPDLVGDTATFEPGRASAALAALNPSQRLALTLRYVDGLSVAEVARLVERSHTATETLLARSRSAFRHRYRELDQADV